MKQNYTFFFFLSFLGWGETESTWYVGHYWPIVPAPDDRWWWMWSSRWNENWQGKPKYSEKTCPSSTISTRNPHDMAWARSWAAWVGSRRLTAWLQYISMLVKICHHHLWYDECIIAGYGAAKKRDFSDRLRPVSAPPFSSLCFKDFLTVEHQDCVCERVHLTLRRKRALAKWPDRKTICTGLM
jgi:hypothetical protein